jgi:hypothetical protein
MRILQIPGNSPVRSDRDRSRLTPEAGLLEYWKGGECSSVGSVLFLSIPANLRDTLGTVLGLPDSKRECFRTINVQWIGQWSFLALVAVPRISKLRVINTPISSTPAVSIIYLFYFQYITDM